MSAPLLNSNFQELPIRFFWSIQGAARKTKMRTGEFIELQEWHWGWVFRYMGRGTGLVAFDTMGLDGSL